MRYYLKDLGKVCKLSAKLEKEGRRVTIGSDYDQYVVDAFGKEKWQ